MNTKDPLGASEIAKYVAERGITDVLHFTTHKGLLGIFASRAVLSRDQLTIDQYVEHIYTPNCADRLKDADWTDYVNLSISRVNGRMLFVSSKKWHQGDDVWWAVLAFDSSVLADPGVFFTSTNNSYRDTVRRGTGVAGLSELFADRVPWGYYGAVATRHSRMPSWWPTDEQAEVLYPRSLSTDRLTAIYVRDGDHLDFVNSLVDLFPGVPRVPVTIKPEVFQ